MSGEAMPPQSMLRSAMAVVADTYASFGWKVPLLFALTLANAVFEGLTLAMLLPLLQTSGMGAGDSRVTRAAASAFGWLGLTPDPVMIGEVLAVFLAASLVVFVAQAYVSTRLQSDYVADWQKRIFAAMVAADWNFLRRQRAGELVGALTTEAARIGGAFYQVNLIASSVIFLLVQIGIAALIAPAITLVLLVLAAVLFGATQHMVRRAVSIGGALTQANAGMFATIAEVSASMKTIKATASEDNARIWLARHIATIRDLTFRNAFDVQVVRAVFEYASTAAVVLLLIVGPSAFHIDVAAVLIVIAIFVRLFPKVTGLRQCIQSVGLVLPAFDSLRALLRSARSAHESLRVSGVLPVGRAAGIALSGLSVDGDAGEPILRNVSLAIRPGEHVAFVGPTGAGKTALLDCVLGLAKRARGEVLIDGRPLGELDVAAWRRSVGYLGQEPVMLAGSIRDNVAWTQLNAPDRAIADALKAADASFVFALPKGLDTILADRGGTFSGGERQRVALARALLGSPRLLVLDEATSALDVETERRILATVAARRGAVTVLSITHRLSAARDADRIVLLERGEIVEQGTFSELMQRQGRFAAMWRAQEGQPEPLPLAGAIS